MLLYFNKNNNRKTLRMNRKKVPAPIKTQTLKRKFLIKGFNNMELN